MVCRSLRAIACVKHRERFVVGAAVAVVEQFGAFLVERGERGLRFGERVGCGFQIGLRGRQRRFERQDACFDQEVALEQFELLVLFDDAGGEVVCVFAQALRDFVSSSA